MRTKNLKTMRTDTERRMRDLEFTTADAYYGFRTKEMIGAVRNLTLATQVSTKNVKLRIELERILDELDFLEVNENVRAYHLLEVDFSKLGYTLQTLNVQNPSEKTIQNAVLNIRHFIKNHLTKLTDNFR